MLIIGIAGGTGSGKTTVVRKIMESLPQGEVVLLPLDSYYKDSSNVPEDRRQLINFDHPNAFDWDLLHEHILR
ncbi:MAG: zeta toxin family protein, partial [Bacteroidaceae bacterium]|nr:zeta toxin family protein [Bacteroidaceae bacterium]